MEGRVDINDVLVVVARTDFDPHDDDQWRSIWQGYGGGSDANLMRGFFGGSNPEWAGHTDEDEEEFRNVSKELWDLGKFHQPRKFGARPRRLPYHWLETIVPSEELESRPAVKDAWDRFQMIAGLTSSNVTEKHHE